MTAANCPNPLNSFACLGALLLAAAVIVFAVIALARPVRSAEPSREVVVLCFTQPNCGLCVQQKPNWAAFKRGLPTIPVVEVDTTQRPAATQKWNVTTTPTTIVIRADKDGQSIESSRRVGLVSSADMTKLILKAQEPEIQRMGQQIQAAIRERAFGKGQ